MASKRKRSCYDAAFKLEVVDHGILMRMYHKKTGINYFRTVNALTLMAFKFLLCDFDE